MLCRFNDLLLARVFDHQTVVDLAKGSSVPVINALSDKYHPLQLLAGSFASQSSKAPGLPMVGLTQHTQIC